jgi:dolichyl-phosphate-mannose-protein mannosyltransferase
MRLGVALAVPFALYATFVLASWSKPVVGDFNMFLWWARAIVETGLPAVEEAPDRPPAVGNMHPPAYVYTLAASFALFGPRSEAAVVVNVASVLAALTLLYLIVRTTMAAPAMTFAAGAALLLVHPYAVQASLLPDIDVTVMPVAILAYTYAFVRAASGLTVRRELLLGLLFAVVLFTKLTTPLILPVSTGAYLLARGQWRQALRATAIITLVGVAAFIVGLTLFAAVSGFPAWGGLGHSVRQVENHLSRGAAGHLRFIAATLKTDALWFGVPYLLLIGAALARRLREGVGPARARPTDFLWITALGIYVAYTLVIPSDGDPRYKAAILFLLTPAVGGLLAQELSRLRSDAVTLALFGSGFLAALGYYALGPDVISTAGVLAGGPALGAKVGLGLYYLLPVVAATLAGLMLPRLRRMGSLPVVWALIMVAFSLASDAKHALAEDPQLIGRGNGQRGLLAAAEYLRQNTAPGEPIISSTDVAYYSGNRPYSMLRWVDGQRSLDVARIRSLIATTPVRYLVIEDRQGRASWDLRVTPAVRDLLTLHFCLEWQSRDFQIYRVRRGLSCVDSKSPST